MRNSFADELTTLAADHPDLWLVVGDLGYSVIETFRDRFPDRFLNAGVAEQSMTGLAAGLALSIDATVFTYSIANFPLTRCLEQVRNDIGYHEANVKVVSVGGGLAYGSQGYSHHAVEDLAFARALPGFTVCAPADPAEARALARLALRTPGPWYIRLGKNGEPDLHHGERLDLELGQMTLLREGDDGCLVATGAVAANAYAAAERLADEGHSLRVLTAPFVSPLDREALARAAEDCPFILTVEEHVGPGGFGSAVAELFVDEGWTAHTRLARAHLPGRVEGIGSQEYLRARAGLDVDSLVARLQQLVS